MTECNDTVGANLKCVIISLILAGAYWYFPPKNKWILVSILYFTYIIIYWYDEYYNCDGQFKTTYLHHFYSWAKGDDYKKSLVDLFLAIPI